MAAPRHDGDLRDALSVRGRLFGQPGGGAGEKRRSDQAGPQIGIARCSQQRAARRSETGARDAALTGSDRRMKKTLLPPLIPLVLVTLMAEFLARAGFLRAYLVPPPSAVLRAIIDSRVELVQALLFTSAGALAGFIMSALTGIAIAVLL